MGTCAVILTLHSATCVQCLLVVFQILMVAMHTVPLVGL